MIHYLPEESCPRCREPLTSRGFEAAVGSSAPRVSRFEDCLRQCERCGIGLSNARRGATVVFKDPLGNIPEQVREGAKETVWSSLNERNRESKWARFGFCTSEDAITWTLFSYLARSGRLKEVIGALAPQLASAVDQEPVLLLWGAPFPMTEVGAAVRKRLTEISDRMGEEPMSRSEPDVVLRMANGAMMLIEVKHRSGNDWKAPDYRGWSKGYLRNTDVFVDPNGAQASGHYELARNWRFAAELAQGSPFALVNLGPDTLRAEGQRERLQQFELSLLQSSKASFEVRTWDDLMHNLIPLPTRLDQFLMDRLGERIPA